MRNSMRAYVSDNSRRRDGGTPPKPMVIRLGGWRTAGSLYPMQAPQRSEVKMCNPDGSKGVKRCWTDGEQTYWDSQVKRGIPQDDGTFKVVDAEAEVKAKASNLDVNVMRCSVHEPAETKNKIWPDTNKKSFVFYPTESDTENVLTARALVPVVDELVVMSYFNLQNHEGVYRLMSWNNRLVIQPQLYTNEFHNHELDETPMPDEVTEAFVTFAASLAEPFDSAAYENLTRDRVRAARIAEKGREDVREVRERAEVDFMSVLRHAMEEAPSPELSPTP